MVSHRAKSTKSVLHQKSASPLKVRYTDFYRKNFLTFFLPSYEKILKRKKNKPSIRDWFTRDMIDKWEEEKYKQVNSRKKFIFRPKN